jgi:hypothetical protein
MLCPVSIKRIVVGLLVVSLIATLACQGDRSVESDPATAGQPVPDIDDGNGSTEGSLYMAGNAYHEHKMLELFSRADVAGMVSSYQSRDFDLSPENSFTVDGSDDELGVSVTFIALIGRGEFGDQSVIVACFESGGDFGIVPAVFTTNPPKNESGWELIADGVWTRCGVPGDINLSSQRFLNWWSWDYFANCMMSHAPDVAIGCTTMCMGATGYFHCFLICAATETLVVTVACLIETYQYGRWERKQQ